MPEFYTIGALARQVGVTVETILSTSGPHRGAAPPARWDPPLRRGPCAAAAVHPSSPRTRLQLGGGEGAPHARGRPALPRSRTTGHHQIDRGKGTVASAAAGRASARRPRQSVSQQFRERALSANGGAGGWPAGPCSRAALRRLKVARSAQAPVGIPTGGIPARHARGESACGPRFQLHAPGSGDAGQLSALAARRRRMAGKCCTPVVPSSKSAPRACVPG